MISAEIKNYQEIDINYREIYYYYGIKDCKHEVDEAMIELQNALSYKVVYTILDMSEKDGEIDFGVFKVNSKDLAKNLSGCKKVVLFLATIGIEIDRLIKKYSVLSPQKSLLFQAIGTERIEALCDKFCSEIKNNYGLIKPRYSAGYGDLKLQTQKDIFEVLNPSSIGVTLSDGMLMTPSKSVTAFVGIYQQKI